jgi:peptidoglycan/LPS O-acetylase OafA/YrhL
MPPVPAPLAGGFAPGRRPELDGLRGLAVLAVMAYHSDLRRVLPGGFLGVDLFFVLSGFLITALLLREHRQSGCVRLPRFYLRRALRLFPALFVTLAACCLWAAFRTPPARGAGIYRAALLTAGHGANLAWVWSAPLDLLGHAWSLSLEEQFYLAWPVLLFLLLRFGVSLRRIGWLILAGIAASALLRAALWLGLGPSYAGAIAVSLATRADSLLAGCLAGVIISAGGLPQSPGGRTALRAAAWTSAALLLLFALTAREGASYLHLGGFTTVAVAAAVLIAALAHSPPRRVAPPLCWVGRISYGLYLWHFPLLSIAPKLIHGIVPATRHAPGVDGVLACALAFAAAALSYYAVEWPFLRWKDRLGAPAPAGDLISSRSSRRSGRGTLAASSGRAGCPA